MKEFRSRPFRLYLLSVLAGFFLVAIELLLNLFNRSICPTKGCKIAENLLLISKNHLLIIALLYFVFLFLLSVLYSSSRGQLFKLTVLFLIGLGFMGDGFLVLKLLGEYRVKCIFCLLIGGLLIVITLSGIIALSHEKLSYHALISLILGSLTGLTGAFFISTPLFEKSRLDERGALIVYAQGCLKCEELLKDPNYAKLPRVPVSGIYPFLKVVGVETLPIVIEKKEGKICILEPREKFLEETSCPTTTTQGGLCVIP